LLGEGIARARTGYEMRFMNVIRQDPADNVRGQPRSRAEGRFATLGSRRLRNGAASINSIRAGMMDFELPVREEFPAKERIKLQLRVARFQRVQSPEL